VDAGAFVRDGFVTLRGEVDPQTAAACRELIWGSLEGRGLRRDDPARWPSHLDITDLAGEAFTAAATAPVLTAAYDELIGPGRADDGAALSAGAPAPGAVPADVDDVGAPDAAEPPQPVPGAPTR
jgi:hypothetical protein